MSSLKVMTVFGTRPEIIRLSRVMARLDECCRHIMVHTGQSYDYELSGIFFEEMGIRKPDHFLEAGGVSLGEMLGKIMQGAERVIAAERPDAVLILGDTNSALAAIMACRMKVPVYHMEAGNRCFDRNVPEETNRRLVDHIADFNLVYTEHARRHLLSEGLPHRRVYLTGSPLREVLDHYRPGIDASRALETLGLAAGRYILASCHREENVDDPARLAEILRTLDRLASAHDMPVIVSCHPRTRARIERLADYKPDSRVRHLRPLGFFDYNRLQAASFCVLSDSGTIAEESAILGFPAVTPRDSIERPEALDAGSLVITGLNSDAILDGVAAVTRFCAARRAAGLPHPLPAGYDIPDTSLRVASLILGTARLSHGWDGIRAPVPPA